MEEKKNRKKKAIIIVGAIATIGLVSIPFLPKSQETLVQQVVKEEAKKDASDKTTEKKSEENNSGANKDANKLDEKVNYSNVLTSADKELDKVVDIATGTKPAENSVASANK